ncbi:amidohydrolase family protein [Altibacter sp. HG106]|uniref:amidohydrolase family protein n=1 Tax=Altibacter sp. HG106 TaxID=3023937 RepID=UPI00234FDC6F|nr:amidohydrolase family protein [Altibacter sp. HG106]MDC7993815.1 amidohydrolase family protein [Altibacter sp. HG106]
MKAFYFLILIVSTLSYGQSFVVTNATVFDGEELHENTSVLVENGLITKVGTNITAKTKQIDGTGKFLMPALTNSHVHAWSALALAEAAQAGVLHLLDMHGMEQYQKTMATLNDSTQYANYFYAGAAATAPEGHGTQFGFEAPTLSTPGEASAFVTERLAAGAHYLKIIVEPWKNTLSKETVSALIASAHANKIPAVVHISKVGDADFVLSEGADGLVHIWWDAPMDKQRLKRLANQNDFFVIPTLLTSVKLLASIRSTSTEEVTFLTDEAIFAEVKKVYEAGIPILVGTDPPNAQINYGTDLYEEMRLLVEAGVPAIEVLKGATSAPAKYFRLGNTGVLQAGYRADMLLLEANPLTDITNMNTLENVWKHGKPVRLSNKN